MYSHMEALSENQARGSPCNFGDGVWITGKNEAACAADASREVVERWLPKG